MFKDRAEAGKKLARRLEEELSTEVRKNATVLAIPRGGVVIGSEISRRLCLPLDCLITKKIPAPGQEELTIGAIGEGGVVVWEEDLVERLNTPLEYKQEIVKEKADELAKKEGDFRGGKNPPQIQGKTVVITDDGVATGATIKAAVAVTRNFKPREIVVAVPIIARDSLEEIKKIADRVVYLEAPEMFFSLNQFYQDFGQISDAEILDLLKT